MNLKKDYVLRQVADMWIVMALGTESVDFNGMLMLNDTGALLWKTLEAGGGLDAMADALTGEYNITREQALTDAAEFWESLRKAGCTEN